MKRRYGLSVALLFCLLAGCGGEWSSGDRVLVSKFAYDAGVSQPKRFDVVVFKYPVNPVERGVAKNYIKRLLGLPGEILAIFFGRLFRCGPPTENDTDENNPYNFERWHKEYSVAGQDPLQLWHQLRTSEVDQRQRSQFKDDYAFELWHARGSIKNKRTFEIVRKPVAVMMAMRRIVFDNDHLADDLKGIVPPRWAPVANKAWTNSNDGKMFTHPGEGNQVDWLSYRHILRPSDWPKKDSPDYEDSLKKIKASTLKPALIMDSMGYNSNRPGGSSGQSWVGDLMLECKLTVSKAAGEFRMELSKGIDRFQARWDLQTGTCTLLRIDKKGREEQLAEQATALKTAGEFQLRFANIDERLTVWVDGALPFGDGHEYAPPERYGPDDEPDETKNNDLQPASIGSKGAAVQVQQMRLWRDTYYARGINDHGPDRGDRSDPSKWTALHSLEVRTFYVYPGHYFCLGDNSPQSLDGRTWGLVPERLMLGRALLVYYPFDRAGRIK